MRLLVVPLLVLGVGACRVGANPASSPAARSPHGVDVIVWGGRSARSPFTGELLAVSDSGIYVLTGPQVYLYPLGSGWTVKAYRTSGLKDVHLDQPVLADLHALSRYARYPFGLDDRWLKELVRAMGQDSVAVRRAGEGGG